MDTKQLEYVLEELRFSADMPRDVLIGLASMCQIEHVTGGSVVFRERDKNDNLFLIRSGSLALEVNVPGRGIVRLLTVGPGEMVGWSSILDQVKMTATVVAVEDSELVYAPATKLRELSEADHEFGFHLMKQMAGELSKRLVATRLQLLDLFADEHPAVPASTPEE